MAESACPAESTHGRPFRYCGVKGCGWMEAGDSAPLVLQSDSLADVVRGARVEPYYLDQPMTMIDRRIAAAVRAHIAAALDAEEAKYPPPGTSGYQPGNNISRFTIRALRAALLGTTEETPGG